MAGCLTWAPGLGTAATCMGKMSFPSLFQSWSLKESMSAGCLQIGCFSLTSHFHYGSQKVGLRSTGSSPNSIPSPPLCQECSWQALAGGKGSLLPRVGGGPAARVGGGHPACSLPLPRSSLHWDQVAQHTSLVQPQLRSSASAQGTMRRDRGTAWCEWLLPLPLPVA